MKASTPQEAGQTYLNLGRPQDRGPRPRRGGYPRRPVRPSYVACPPWMVREYDAAGGGTPPSSPEVRRAASPHPPRRLRPLCRAHRRMKGLARHPTRRPGAGLRNAACRSSARAQADRPRHVSAGALVAVPRRVRAVRRPCLAWPASGKAFTGMPAPTTSRRPASRGLYWPPASLLLNGSEAPFDSRSARTPSTGAAAVGSSNDTPPDPDERASSNCS